MATRYVYSASIRIPSIVVKVLPNVFILCRPEFVDGKCLACSEVEESFKAGLRGTKERYARRIRNKRVPGVNWDPEDNYTGGWLSGFASRELVDAGGRRWRIPVRQHACVFGERPTWRPWFFVHPKLANVDRPQPPKEVYLEVQLKVIAPLDMHDGWICEFPVEANLPFRAPLDDWVGASLELQGRVILRGERPKRRVGPLVQWVNDEGGEWINDEVPGRPKIANIKFICHMTFMPRCDIECWGMSLRWVPKEEGVTEWRRTKLTGDEGVQGNTGGEERERREREASRLTGRAKQKRLAELEAMGGTNEDSEKSEGKRLPWGIPNKGRRQSQEEEGDDDFELGMLSDGENAEDQENQGEATVNSSPSTSPPRRRRKTPWSEVVVANGYVTNGLPNEKEKKGGGGVKEGRRIVCFQGPFNVSYNTGLIYHWQDGH